VSAVLTDAIGAAAIANLPKISAETIVRLERLSTCHTPYS
jgi:hypothetical protein